MNKKMLPLMFILLAATAVIFQNCGLEAPGFVAKSSIDDDGNFFINPTDHTNFSKTNCTSCHSSKTPALPHVQNQECSFCHTDSRPWEQPLGNALVAGFTNPINHSGFSATNCTSCHTNAIPASPHIQQDITNPQPSECSNCHSNTQPWKSPTL